MITNQAYLFLIFIINGVLIGLLFDFFRILRKSFKTKDMITYIQDIIFWILTGFIILYSTFTFNNGEIRIFMFVAILLGVVFYMMLISSYVITVNVTIINFIKNIILKTFNIILLPFKWIYKIIEKILYKPINWLKQNIFNLFHKMNTKKQNLTKKLQMKLKNDKEKYEKTKNVVKN